MAIISANLQFNRGGHGLLDYSSLQKNYSAALLWAQDVNSNAAVGQFIYLEEAETIEEVTYAKGPYVVDAIGEGAVLTPLSKSVAGEQDLSGAISDLQGEVGTLKSGLATTDSSVNTLESKVAALPATFVTDVKDASGNSVVTEGVVTLGDYATKSELESAIGGIDFSTLATKTEVSEGLATKADASVVYTKDEVDSAFVKSEGYVAFSQDEKTKLAGVAEGAEVNYVKSVGENLAVDGDGKLTVSIPEVEVPFQSIAEGDNVLALNDGVLSSTLSYAREEVDGVDSLVLKGINGAVIGSVPVADFIADGMLENAAPKEEGSNIFVFTFNSAAGSKSFEVDFSKYVDTYHADGETIELGANNTFNVKAGVFEAAGAAATAEQNAKDYADGKFQIAGNYEAAGAAAAVESKLDEYKTSNDAAVAAKVDSSVYNAKMTEIDGSISSINDDLAKKADASTVETALNGKVDVVEGSSLVSDELITKLGNMVEIKSVSGDLTFTDGALSLDLSEYAKSGEVANTYVAKEEGKGLSTNDFTNDLKTKLDGIAAGAEVNYVKSVGANLAVSNVGELTVDLSALATSEALTNGLAAKLDASAKVNGVSFVDGVATLTAGNVALETAITRTENGEEKNVYEATASIQSVLANLSARIDTLDPNISGEFGVSAVTAGNGIEVSGASSTPTISVKASAVEGNIAEVKTDGIYVAAPEVPDMRSYWEAI